MCAYLDSGHKITFFYLVRTKYVRDFVPCLEFSTFVTVSRQVAVVWVMEIISEKLYESDSSSDTCVKHAWTSNESSHCRSTFSMKSQSWLKYSNSRPYRAAKMIQILLDLFSPAPFVSCWLNEFNPWEEICFTSLWCVLQLRWRQMLRTSGGFKGWGSLALQAE